MSAASAAKQGWATMVPVPGGTFAMGSEDFYPEERPVRQVTVSGFLMDERQVTAARVPALRSRDRLRHGGRAPARPGRLPGRRSGAARARLARVPKDGRPGAARRRPELVGVRSRRLLEATGRPGQLDQRPRPAPGRPGRLRGRRGLRGVGRGRSFRPRPSGSSRLAAAWTVPRSPGATSTRPAARRWRTPGRASSPGRT